MCWFRISFSALGFSTPFQRLEGKKKHPTHQRRVCACPKSEVVWLGLDHASFGACCNLGAILPWYLWPKLLFVQRWAFVYTWVCPPCTNNTSTSPCISQPGVKPIKQDALPKAPYITAILNICNFETIFTQPVKAKLLGSQQITGSWKSTRHVWQFSSKQGRGGGSKKYQQDKKEQAYVLAAT